MDTVTARWQGRYMPRRKKPTKPPVQAPEGTTVNLRLSTEELAAFKTAAVSTGLSLSAWLRLVGRRASGLPTP
jgi:predicted DNA binding CopG/RHH family protein